MNPHECTRVAIVDEHIPQPFLPEELDLLGWAAGNRSAKPKVFVEFHLGRSLAALFGAGCLLLSPFAGIGTS